jgi:hypothetical protein
LSETNVKRLLLLLVLAILVWTGCGGGSMSSSSTSSTASPGTPNADISGNWNFTTGDIDYNAVVTQTGNQLSAAFPIAGNPDSSFTGTISGNSVNITFYGTTVSATVSGTTMTGTYSSSMRSGEFSATFYPSVTSSSWTSKDGSVTLTANLSEDNSGNVTGSATIASSNCSVTTDVTG